MSAATATGGIFLLLRPEFSGISLITDAKNTPEVIGVFSAILFWLFTGGY